MKRSKAAELIADHLRYRLMTEQFALDILEVVELIGMLPPPAKVQHYDGDNITTAYECSWEPED